MLSKEIQEVIKMLRASKLQNKGKEMTAENALMVRAMLNERMGAISTPPHITVETVDDKSVKGDFLRYDGEDSDKINGSVLLFLHGGGFVTGSTLSRRFLCAGIMKEAKMDAFVAAYRQWPEAVHPAALNDSIAAYRWLINQGYQPENIHVFGESAGAMLTLTMILYLKDHKLPLPKSACVFSPVAGQGIILPSHMEREDRDPMISFESVIPYYAEADFDNPYVSPRYGDYKGFPKLFIHVGTEEVLFDDAVLIEKLCSEAGVDVSMKVWDELFHVFPLFPCPETDVALQEIGEFFRKSR